MNLATFTAAVLLLATVPQETGVLRDEVDAIEVNVFCDENARQVFVQALFIDWCQSKGCEQVCDWRLVKNVADQPRLNIEVRRDYKRGGYVATWDDGGKLREVRAATYRETFTQVDPELKDRDCHPQDRRRKLAIRERVERSVLKERWTE